MPFRLLQTLNTEYCADSVEWCPIQPYCHYFVCGTYELANSDNKAAGGDEPQSRIGQLHLFSVKEHLELHLHFTADTTAILDIKWCPNQLNNQILIASSNADGTIILWEFKNDNTSYLTCLSKFEVNTEDILSLSLDWSDNDNSKICVSDSKGFLTVLKLNSKHDLEILHKLKIHDYEAWIAAFNFWNSSVIVTGGDDCLIKIIDLRVNPAIVSRQNEHSCGVTSVKFNHLKENLMATGSYDETIKLWDDRNMKRSLSTFTVGGGIWRIKWDPFNASNILTAAMYSGVYQLKYSNEAHSLQQLDEFKEHKSIAYGADYCRIPPSEIIHTYFKNHEDCTDNSRFLTATCSFYDKKLCLCVL